MTLPTAKRRAYPRDEKAVEQVAAAPEPIGPLDPGTVATLFADLDRLAHLIDQARRPSGGLNVAAPLLVMLREDLDPALARKVFQAWCAARRAPNGGVP